ncbi:MAG: VOC family protein, partial [Deltaproteobacteria bacterium]
MSFTIKRTFHTGFCVADLDWTIAFFQQVLGFKLIDKAPRDPANQSFITGAQGAQVMIAYMDCAGHSLELQDYSSPADRQHYRPRMVDMGHFHVSFVVDDVDAVV